MKLQFKNQKFQSDAAKAVTDSFVGQRNQEMQDYTLDLGRIKGASQDAFVLALVPRLDTTKILPKIVAPLTPEGE